MAFRLAGSRLRPGEARTLRTVAGTELGRAPELAPLPELALTERALTERALPELAPVEPSMSETRLGSLEWVQLWQAAIMCGSDRSMLKYTLTVTPLEGQGPVAVDEQVTPR